MSKVTAAIEAKNKSQNLFEFFGNLPKEFKYDKIGLSSDFYEDKSFNTKEYPEYSKVFIIRTGYRDPEIVNEYFQKFINGKLKPEPYFTKKDGDVYWLVKRFFESRINTQESDKNLANLARHFNVLNRQVNNDMYKKYDSLGDKLAAPAVRKAYYTGKCNGKQNPLKEAAWIVVHSYVIDRFFSENYQYRLIPKHQELVPLWNSYINSMDDIPDIVKKYYILNEKCESPFTYHYKNETLKEKEDYREVKPVTGYISTDPVMDEHPMDDKEPGAVEEHEVVAGLPRRLEHRGKDCHNDDEGHEQTARGGVLRPAKRATELLTLPQGTNLPHQAQGTGHGAKEVGTLRVEHEVVRHPIEQDACTDRPDFEHDNQYVEPNRHHNAPPPTL